MKISSIAVLLIVLKPMLAFGCDADYLCVRQPTAKVTEHVSADGVILLQVFPSKPGGGIRLVPGKRGWPTRLSLRFHLDGLEHFAVRTGDLELSLAVRSLYGRPVVQSMRRDGKRQGMSKGHPYFIKATLPNPDKPDIRFGGPIELELPATLLRDSPRELVIHWVDFYRL